MKRCKITILQRTLNEKLAREYAAPGFTKCPMMREGQVFYADYAKPEGFCDEAWKAVYQYVFALSHGAGKFYFGDWITKEGVAICSCNDGLRPVIMKIERTDEGSSISYEPVEQFPKFGRNGYGYFRTALRIQHPQRRFSSCARTRLLFFGIRFD